jgi:hypothetical protein
MNADAEFGAEPGNVSGMGNVYDKDDIRLQTIDPAIS